ncbi:MAG: hypothetical protein ACJ8D6_05985 [Sphingomicrobium sp.]
MGEVERAVLATRCDKAEAAADAVLAKLEQRQHLAFAEKDQPRLEQAQK